MSLNKNSIKSLHKHYLFLNTYDSKLREFLLLDDIYCDLTLKGKGIHNKIKTYLENNITKYLELGGFS